MRRIIFTVLSIFVLQTACFGFWEEALGLLDKGMSKLEQLNSIAKDMKGMASALEKLNVIEEKQLNDLDRLVSNIDDQYELADDLFYDFPSTVSNQIPYEIKEKNDALNSLSEQLSEYTGHDYYENIVEELKAKFLEEDQILVEKKSGAVRDLEDDISKIQQIIKDGNEKTLNQVSTQYNIESNFLQRQLLEITKEQVDLARKSDREKQVSDLLEHIEQERIASINRKSDNFASILRKYLR
tara:strand:+ start:139 stop:861 length:723 start_codon:yes stop_codon:yes gene_type:complete